MVSAESGLIRNLYNQRGLVHLANKRPPGKRFNQENLLRKLTFVDRTETKL